MLLRAARRLASTAAADGVRINWQKFTPRKGVNPGATPLLLIHGFACGADDWGSLARAIATKSNREVLSFDNRGVGGSSSPSGPYTVDLMAQDALQVLDSANVARAHVLGISLGGMIAQTLALAAPERVHGLVLGCTTHGGREAPAPAGDFVSLAMRWAGDDSCPPNENVAVDDFLSWMLPAEAAATPSGAQLVEHLKQFFRQTPRTAVGLQGQLAAMGRFNSTEKLVALGRHPTLVIAGDADAVVPAANSESLHRRIPGAELVMRPGAGHFFWADKPAECSATLAAFLSRCDQPGSGLKVVRGLS